MATQVQIRRGTTAEHGTFTGAVGELTVDTDKDVVVVHDGATVGGRPMLRENGSQNLVTTGTATAASFIPTSSTAPTNGVYLPAANSVAISTNGTGRLFIDASGNVGVGVVSPSTRLQASGNIWATGGEIAGGNTETTGTTGTFRIVGTSGGMFIQSGQNRTSGSALPIVFSNIFAANEYMRITSAGLVGIGASSISEQLQLGQNGSGTDNYIGIWGDQSGSNGEFAGIKFFNNQANASSTPVKQVASIYAARDGDNFGGALYFQTANPSSGSQTLGTRMLLDSSGRLGIGTTGPEYRLDVSGSGTQYARCITTDTSGSAVGVLRAEYLGGGGGVNTNVELRAGNAYSYLVTTTNHPILFGTNGTERARIDSSGRLLVGTSSAVADASTVSRSLQILGTTAATAGQFIARFDNGINAPGLVLGKSRGATVGTYTVVNSGDQIGRIAFDATDGTKFVNSALIAAEVDGTPGVDDMPGRLVFSTTADGASSPTERMRISSDGAVKIAGDNFQIATSKTPASATAAGTTGQVAWDASYIYVCTATNTWKRAALSTW